VTAVRFSGPAMTPAQLQRWLDGTADLALFDVRDPVEAARGHIVGMTNLPRGRLEARIRDLVRDPRTPIALYDDGFSGRAEWVAQTLAGLGYGNVAWLHGGVQAWERSGLMLAPGSNVPSKRFGEQALHRFDVPLISADALVSRLADNDSIRVCDVSTPEEHAEHCIPGARGIAGFDLALHARDLADRCDVLVVHCAGRTRSIIAAQTLRELGISNVAALENGTMGWLLAGRSLEEGARDFTPTPSAASAAYAESRAAKLAEQADVARIAGAALARLLAQEDENYYVFDVRGVDAYRAGHIPGSLALPGAQAVQRIDDFIPLKQAPIVLVAQREAQACLTGLWLRRMGCRNVSILSGGIDAWLAQGRALECGTGRVEPAGYRAARAQVRFTSAQVLAQRLATDPDAVRIFDVGHSVHFRRGHLPGAQWLARSRLEAAVCARWPDRTMPLALVSRDGVQAVFAAATLGALGYRDVVCLQGGTLAWQAAGYAVEQDGLATQDDELLPPYRCGAQAMRDYLAWEQGLADPYALFQSEQVEH